MKCGGEETDVAQARNRSDVGRKYAAPWEPSWCPPRPSHASSDLLSPDLSRHPAPSNNPEESGINPFRYVLITPRDPFLSQLRPFRTIPNRVLRVAIYIARLARSFGLATLLNPRCTYVLGRVIQVSQASTLCPNERSVRCWSGPRFIPRSCAIDTSPHPQSTPLCSQQHVI